MGACVCVCVSVFCFVLLLLLLLLLLFLFSGVSFDCTVCFCIFDCTVCRPATEKKKKLIVCRRCGLLRRVYPKQIMIDLSKLG